MNTYVLATVGVSMAANLRRELAAAHGSLPDQREAIAFLRKQTPRDRVCGAEINSLAALLDGAELSEGVARPPAIVHLLVSDTPEGEWVGRVLSDYLPRWGGPEIEGVEVDRVSDLDGADYRRFANHGLRSLVRIATQRLQSAREQYPGALRVIDATGGYKAQISFAGLIGQVMQVPVVYLFEQFPRCIELPPLPVGFDRSLWFEHYWLFSQLSDDGIARQRDIASYQVDRRIANLLDCEDVDGEEFVALSPVLELIHQGFSLVPPVGAQPPPDADIEASAKHRGLQTQHHRPDGFAVRMRQLADLPWVTRVEATGLVDTPTRSRVKTHGTEALEQILVVHGDGSMGVEIRLSTTCTTEGERAWCLEALKELMA